MKILLVSSLALIMLVGVCAGQGSHRVNGYYQKDGTFVPSHYRTNANGSIYDNWSTRGNYNPYTGVAGTVNPYAPRSGGRYSYDIYGNAHYVPGH